MFIGSSSSSSMSCTCCCHPLIAGQNPGHGYNVLELYAGIGGMNYALEALQLPLNLTVTSMDINNNANQVNAHNFPSKRVLYRNITSLSSHQLDDMNLDLITMSPPCQPFTRLGLKGDMSDNRTDSLVHILENVLPKMRNRAKNILVENVKGFEDSQARDLLVNTLAATGYEYKEFIISPVQLNIPNSRLRYYLMAGLVENGAQDKVPLTPFDSKEKIKTELPKIDMKSICLNCRRLFFPESIGSKEEEAEGIYELRFPRKLLTTYLEENEAEEYLLPDKVLHKYSHILDIVTYSSEKTCCFTRSYAHLVLGTGSVLQTNCDLNMSRVYDEVTKWQEDEDPESSRLRIESLKELRLRYFTPREVSNLMHFPKHFSWPSKTTKRQKYQLLGNSVNVKVISLMLKLLFLFDNHL